MSTFDEKYEAWKAKRSEQTSKSGADSSDTFESKYTAWKIQAHGDEIINDLKSRVDAFIGNTNTYIGEHNSRYENWDNSYESDYENWYKSRKYGYSSLTNEYNEITGILDKYAPYLDKDWTESVRSALDGNIDSSKSILKYAEDGQSFWSQFENEDQYNAWTYTNDYKDYSYDDIQNEITNLEKNRPGDGTEEDIKIGKKIDFLDVYARQKEYDTGGDYLMALNDIDDQIDGLMNERQTIIERMAVYRRDGLTESDQYKNDEKRRNEIDAQLTAIGTDKAALEKRKDEKIKADEVEGYAYSVMANPDFIEKSAYNPTPNRTPEELKAAGYRLTEGGDPNNPYDYYYISYGAAFVGDRADVSYTGEDGDFYTFINDLDARAGILRNNRHEQYYENGYHLLEDREVATYNYLYQYDKENGTTRADEYRIMLIPTLKSRVLEKEAEMYAADAKEHPVSASVFSVGTNLVNAAMFAPKLAATVTGAYDDDPMLNRYGNITESIRGSVAEDLGYWGGLVYQGGMSLADMGAAMLIGAGAGTSTAVTGKIVQGIMSSSAGSSAISMAKDNGASDGKALILGLGSAAIEWATEKYSVEALLKNPKNILGYLATNTFTEGTEEGVSNLANIALDNIVSEVFGEQSEIRAEIDMLVLQGGMSESEAAKQVLLSRLQSLGEDVFVGALSGAGMSAGMLSSGYVKVKADEGKTVKKAGVDINDNGRLQELVKITNDLDDTKGNVKLKAMANELAGVDTSTLSESQKNAFSKKVGNLYRKVLNAQNKALGTADQDAIKGIVIEKLRENGVAEADISKVADVILKATYQTDKVLSNSEKAIYDRVGGKEIQNYLLTHQEDVDYAAAKKSQERAGQFMHTAGLTAKDGKIDTSEYSTSDDGKTYVKVGDESVAVEITGVSSINKKGEVIVNLSNGETAKVKDLDLGSVDDAILFEGIAGMDIDAGSAQLIYKAFKNTKKLNGKNGKSTNAMTFIKGAMDAVKYGRIGGEAYLDEGVFTSMLNEVDRKAFYRIGEIAAENQAKKNAATVKKAIRSNKGKGPVRGNVSFDGVDPEKLNARQKVSVNALNAAFGAMGVRVVFFESPVNERGIHTGENGSYDPETNTIRLDIAAGIQGKDTILFTAAHELTHFIKEWSPVKFKAFSDFLVAKYAAHGIDVDTLVQRKIEASKNSKTYEKPLTYDEAFEEVVADSCETFLRDSHLMDKLIDLAKKDLTLFERCKLFIENLLADLKKAYNGLAPDSLEAKYVLDMKDCIADLHQMWEDAALSARNNFQAAGGKKAQKNTTKGGAKMQLRGFTKDGRSIYESDFAEDVSKDERVALFKDRIATVFNLGAVELKTDVKKLVIQGDRFTAQKNLFGDDFASEAEIEAKINALYDMADMLATSKYLPQKTKKEESYSNQNIKPKNAAHKNVKYWYKFQNEIVFDGVPYTVTFNIRDKGKQQYQYLIDFKENKTPGLSNTIFKKHKDLLRADQVSNNSIREDTQKSQGKNSDREKNPYVAMGKEFYKDESIYSYDFLVNQKPMVVLKVPNLDDIYTDGRVDKTKIVAAGKKNALAQEGSKSGAKGVVYVKNRYTDRTIEINNQSIKHGLGGKRNYIITNARLGMIIGDVIRNGIPINELTPSDGANGTYALVAYATSPAKKEFLVIAHIDVHKNTLVGLESVDAVHSIRGRIKRGSTTAVNSAQGPSEDGLSFGASVISISDLLDFVNHTSQSLLSEDVLEHLGERREREGFYYGQVLHQVRDPYADAKFSSKGYWRTGFSRAECNELVGIAKFELGKSTGYIDNETKWLYNNKQGKNYFAIYSTIDIDNPTILYASKGKTAQNENQWFEIFIAEKELLENGSNDLQRTTINEVLVSLGYALDQSGVYNGVNANQRGGNNRNVRVYSGASGIRPSRALRNCLENLAEIQERRNGVTKYSDRDPYAVEYLSPRNLLANALESTIDTSMQAGQNELRKLKEYKAKIRKIEAFSEELSEVNAMIRKKSFTKGEDRSDLAELQARKTFLEDQIDRTDKKLLQLEETKPLRNVLERERKKGEEKVQQKYEERIQEQRIQADERLKEVSRKYQESRKKGIESRNKTALRGKIKRTVKTLNDLLLKGNENKHIPIKLQKAVAAALDAVNMDTVGSEERVAKYDALIAEATDPDVIASLKETRERIQGQGDRLGEKIALFKAAYEEIKNSEDADMANAYDETIVHFIESVEESVGDTSLRDMDLSQLELVYDMYRAVLKTVKRANQSFKLEKDETIAAAAENVLAELGALENKKDYVLGGKFGEAVHKAAEFEWNNLKPVYAFERIGSKTLMQAYENIRKGEDVWAVDVEEAKRFKDEVATKYGYADWDFDRLYTFKTTTGQKFHVSLEQMLSLYAYSKRKQADKHLEIGGFIFSDSIETYKENEDGKKSILKYRINNSRAHKVDAAILEEIKSKLTVAQIAFVDEMQTYLSDVMGAKGNEVSMAMYDIKLFKEKNYFPLKSAKQYLFEKNEVVGELRVKNSGFAYRSKTNANNPIVLENFLDVWAQHINDMSMYHAFVLPLEDFNRIFNYKTPISKNADQESVKSALGEQADAYISQLLKDLNSGVRIDPKENASRKMFGKFKKAAVFASASVIIQQPSAVARALALVDVKYFDYKLKIKNHKELWAELKHYAPIAIIKEMGHFDTDTGRGTVDYIKDQKTVLDHIDDIASKPASVMDELTWVHIWTAVKNEVAAENKALDGEAFLQKCGERFTEVVEKTQVYDSVLSRSANMRSKNVFMTMLTSFMAEPTTTLNMVENALVQWKRGDKKAACKSIFGACSSVVLNSFLSSLIYAMRDDDEDETFLEKYLESLTTGLLDGLNPLTYFPILRDVWSILQGYDIERNDMTLISRVAESLKKVITVTSKDDADTWEIASAWWSVAEDTFAVFGLPVENLLRWPKSIVNTWKTANNGLESSMSTVSAEISDEVKGSMPVLSWLPDKSRGERLYDAYLDGDQDMIDRITGQYKDEDAANSALKAAIGEQYKSGEIDSENAKQHLKEFFEMTDEDIHWQMEKWDYAAENASLDGYSKYGDFFASVETGENLKAVINEYVGNGVSKETLAGQITGHFKPVYKEMSNYERASLKGYLLNAYSALGYDRNKKSKDINQWIKD